MISGARLLDLVSPTARVFPEYFVDGADINESLDHGAANCAVRAYAGGLLLRQAYPNPELYIIEFGFAPEHGQQHIGSYGNYTHMGHAAVRFYVPGNQPNILESYTNSMLEIVTPDDEHQRYIWNSLQEGYRAYLDLAGMDDVVIDPDEILRCLINKINFTEPLIRNPTSLPLPPIHS
ncbi:MAG: hypothetical protein ACYCPS_00660 [Candidatus Saccharimonadales bacterium]